MGIILSFFIGALYCRSVIREGSFTPPPEHEHLSPAEVQSALQLGERLGDFWQRVLVQVIHKNNSQVYPLARNAGPSPGLLADVSYSQLLHYVATSNNKNLWKDAFKKYSEHGVAVQWKGGAQVGTDSLHNVLREVIWRLFGCKIIALREEGAPQSSMQGSRLPEPHSNVLPALCALEGEEHVFIILNNVYHSVHQCVSFSPAKLSGLEAGALFILYQILEVARDTHDRGLHLGDITLHQLYIDNALYLRLLPSIPDNLIQPESSQPSHLPKNKSLSESEQHPDSTIGEKRQSHSSDSTIGEKRQSHSSDSTRSTGDFEADSVRTNSPEQNSERSKIPQDSRGDLAKRKSLLPVSKKSEMNQTAQPKASVIEGSENRNSANQADSRLLEYQKLISSEDAFEALRQVLK
ncbi:putative WD repeat-containing protein 81 [Penaeus vannamei]|uniref:Putative WD repeat-containing protein 81 n=1 Tax=Penaeus vannamei TaxID=6689 RepID=A0A3R7M5Z1_PENVA|nr:putative WD repeat-containing protein 81 [Penaeus vannamei]